MGFSLRFKVSLVSLVTLFLIQPSALAHSTDCSDLLLGTTYLEKTTENIPALISRIRPVYSDHRFNVRILSQSASQNTFSPSKLFERTVREVGTLMDAFNVLGFSFTSYLQILVEAHPHAIRFLGLSPDSHLSWKNIELGTPWIGSSKSMIGIPGVFGGNKIFEGRHEKGDFERDPEIFVIPAYSDTYHFVTNRFVLAHELAHQTENVKSHRDLFWREARADYLAYLATGQTDFILPEAANVNLSKQNGETYQVKVNRIRSLRRPVVASLNEAMPDLDLYHFNSQLISSAMYVLGQKLGEGRMIDFIDWMDHQTPRKKLRQLVDESKMLKPSTSPDHELVDGRDVKAVRRAVRNHLVAIGIQIRAWAEQSLTTAEFAVVDGVLSERGI